MKALKMFLSLHLGGLGGTHSHSSIFSIRFFCEITYKQFKGLLANVSLSSDIFNCEVEKDTVEKVDILSYNFVDCAVV